MNESRFEMASLGLGKEVRFIDEPPPVFVCNGLQACTIFITDNNCLVKGGRRPLFNDVGCDNQQGKLVTPLLPARGAAAAGNFVTQTGMSD